MSETLEQRTTAELEEGLVEVLGSPAARGTLELIVRRPSEGEREVLEQGVLDLEQGLVGDRWWGDGADPEAQVTLMNARAAKLIAGAPERWPLAGDQLYVDLDLSAGSLPPGTRLAVGSAVLEITAAPHTGCAKFRARFGSDAIRFVNGGDHRSLRLRGVNARVVVSGTVTRGDTIVRL